MAAVTSTILALGGLGLSAAQMVKANKDKEAAESAAKLAMATIKNNYQQNAFKALHAPDIKSLAEQQSVQTQAMQTQAFQEMGGAGAAMVTAAGTAARESGLKASQAQGELNFKRDAMQAQQQSNINAQKYQAETNLEMANLEGAQVAARDAEESKNAAFEGMFGSLSLGIDSAGDAISDYKTSKAAAMPPPGTVISGDTSYRSLADVPKQNTWDQWSLNGTFPNIK